MDPYLLKNIGQKKEENFGYDEKVDIWSLGTAIYELFIGTKLFNSRNLEHIQYLIDKGIYIIPYEIHLSKEALAFLKGMLQYDPIKRLNIDQLSKHYFLTKNTDNFKIMYFSSIKMDLFISFFDNYLLIPFNEKYYIKLAEINPYDYLDNNDINNNKDKNEEEEKNKKSNYNNEDIENENNNDNDLKNENEQIEKDNISRINAPKEYRKIPLIDDLLEF